MKKIYNLLCALLFVSASFTMSYGQLIFSESFNTSGTLTGGGWTATTATGSGTQNVETVSSFGTGTSAKFTTPSAAASVQRYDKALGGTYAGDDDADGTVYWLGFWFISTGINTTNSASVAAQVLLLNTAGTSGSLDQRIGAGKTSNYTGSTANVYTLFTRASGSCAAQNWPAALTPTVNLPATSPIAIVQNEKKYILIKITKGEYSLNVGSVMTPVIEKFDAMRTWILSAEPTSEASLSSLGDYTTTQASDAAGTVALMPPHTRLLRSAGNTGNTAANCRQSGVNAIRLRVEGVASSDPITVAFDEIRFAKGALSLILPIELLNFTAVKKNQANLLTWATASEKNNIGFYIERSNDATNWQSIGFEKGAGESNQKLTYNFSDETPLSMSYYRLRQVDVDGRETLSKVISVEQKGRLNALLTPNPAGDVLNVTLQNEGKDVAVSVYDMVGRKVLSNTFSGTQSALNVANLVSGIYTISLQSEGKTSIQKFVKI